MTEPPDDSYVMVRRAGEHGRPYVELWRRDGADWVHVSNPIPDGVDGQWWLRLPWPDLVERDRDRSPVRMESVRAVAAEPGS